MISLRFFLLVGITFILYWLIPNKYRYILLLAASSMFIWSANNHSKRAVLLMIGMALIAWLAGLLLQKKLSPKLKYIVLASSVVIEAGLLIRLKEIKFFLRLFNYDGDDFGIIKLIAPLGISYFTLSLIGYILDCYWNVQKAEQNPLKVMLFEGYFPVVTSGPIMRYSAVSGQMFGPHRWSYERTCFGCQRILWGIFKKLVISERLAMIVNAIYADPDTYNGFYIWTAIFAFLGQLYTDFSSCIDIALGVSELLDIALPENFNFPFTASTVAEFWRRWHITLGEWTKNYIFYPLLKSSLFQKIGEKSKIKLGKRYGKKIPTWIAMLIVWFITGFWHGGSWNYIFGVGLWFWMVIVGSELLTPLFQKISKTLHFRTDVMSWKIFQSVRTTFIFSIGLGFFRANSFRNGLHMYKLACTKINPWIFFNKSFLEFGLTDEDYHVLFLALLLLSIAGIIPLSTRKNIRKWIAEQNILFRWILWLGLIFVTLIWGKYGPGYNAAEFIYRGF